MENYIKDKVEDKIEKAFKKGFKILFMILAAIVFILLIAYVFMWLWNWLMPDLFGLTTINYWQGVGLLLLAKLLFCGFGGEGSCKEKKSKKQFKRQKCRPFRRDFSKWERYDEFWKEEGEQAYKNYLKKIENEEETND